LPATSGLAASAVDTVGVAVLTFEKIVLEREEAQELVGL
jgi:hypothetical protein